jgi:hypothetical protein
MPFLNEVHYTAKMAGSRMPGGRLDPPLLMALDEIANIASVNIPNFMADAGGRGIQMAIVSHGVAQLRERGANRARRSSATPQAARSSYRASPIPPC